MLSVAAPHSSRFARLPVKSVEMIFSDRTGNADADRIKAELLPGEKLDLHALPAPARERFGIG